MKIDKLIFVEYIGYTLPFDNEKYRKYFKEFKEENEAKKDCIRYNIVSDGNDYHEYIGIDDRLLETLRKTTKSQEEYEDSVSRYLNSI